MNYPEWISKLAFNFALVVNHDKQQLDMACTIIAELLEYAEAAIVPTGNDDGGKADVLSRAYGFLRANAPQEETKEAHQ